MKMRDLIRGGLTLAVVLAFGAGCSGENAAKPAGGEEAGGAEKPKVAFVTNCVASFWTIAKAGAMTAGADLNADVTVQMPTGGVVDQKRIVEDLLASGIDGIAISPLDPASQKKLLNEAAANTNLITQDSDAPESERLCYVGMDNYSAGMMTGELVKEALPEGGTVMIFVGQLGQDNAKYRRQGVIDSLMGREPDKTRYDEPGTVVKNDVYTILDTRTDNMDEAKAKANAEDTIAANPDLGAMVGLFAYNPPACLAALKDAGKLGKIKVIGFDEQKETLDAIRSGDCVGTVVQDPYRYGYESIRILTALAKGDKSVLPADGFLSIPAKAIRKDNVDAFQKELEANLAKGGN